MSSNGRIVAYYTVATRMLATPSVDPAIYVKDMVTGDVINVTASLGRMAPFQAPMMDLSADGSVLAFTWYTSDPSDPAVFNRALVYTVELRGIQPTAPTPVPGLSRVAVALLAAGVALGAWMGFRRDRRKRAQARMALA